MQRLSPDREKVNEEKSEKRGKRIAQRLKAFQKVMTFLNPSEETIG